MRLKALNNKLADYSLLSGAFILMHQAAVGQVIYTDIDPDTVFDEAEEGAYFDIDGNGVFDFAVLNTSYNIYNVYFYSSWFRQEILANPLLPTNCIAGNSFDYSADFGGFLRYFPFALNNDALISEDLEWHNADIQLMAVKDYISSGQDLRPAFYCNWYSPELSTVNNNFLGLKFIGNDEQIHYGWMRCDVKDNGRTLIVKDYAYELQPNYPIRAGDKVSYVDVNSSTAMQQIAIYSFNKNIYVNILNYQNTQITVYDITGNKIYNKILEGNSSVINMENFAAGIYVVSVKQGENVVTKKVNVE